MGARYVRAFPAIAGCRSSKGDQARVTEHDRPVDLVAWSTRKLDMAITI
jgi:hypothetical protein